MGDGGQCPRGPWFWGGKLVSQGDVSRVGGMVSWGLVLGVGQARGQLCGRGLRGRVPEVPRAPGWGFGVPPWGNSAWAGKGGGEGWCPGGGGTQYARVGVQCPGVEDGIPGGQCQGVGMGGAVSRRAGVLGWGSGVQGRGW